MVTLSSVLVCLADRLRDNGAQLVPRVLDVVGAVLQFHTAMGHAADSDVAAASCLAALLKSDDAKKAAVALGISPDLIPTLSPSVVGVDHQLGDILARGTGQEATVAAAVLFAWYSLAAKAGDGHRVATLLGATEAGTLDGSQNTELAGALKTEMAAVPLSKAPSGPSSSDYLFSISIDLVGSTDAKTRIMKVAQGDPSKIDMLNERIYREFCRIERKFYEGAVNHYGTAPAIDPVNFFTVKGIGDEIWILCHVPAKDVARVGQRLIDVSIEVARQSVRFFATEHDDPSFDPDFDYGSIEPVLSPIKMFVDLVGHASNLGRRRDEALVKVVPDLLKTYHRREPTPLEVVTVARRMGLSSYEPVGWWDLHESRSDYIGHEIDRFFRTTKSAVPGTVTIGASMAREMGLSFKPTAQAILAVFASDGARLRGGVPLDPVHAYMRVLQPNELKGIGYAYETYTLFAPRTLMTLYVHMEADKGNGFPAMPYDSTAALIPPAAVDDLVTEIVKSQ